MAPGKVVHIEGDRFPIGELDGCRASGRTRISEAFTKAGLKCPLLDNVRAEMWLKLWGNLTFNPISALTHATLQDICEDPYGKALAAQMMREAQAVAEHLGITFRVPLDKRIEGARKVGKHKTSMLQDVEAGRPIEIDALVGSVVELGDLTEDPRAHHPGDLPGREAPRHHLHLAGRQHPRRPDRRKLTPLHGLRRLISVKRRRATAVKSLPRRTPTPCQGSS